MITKCCARCKKDLPLSQFHNNRSTKDGLQSYCKECRNFLRIRNENRLTYERNGCRRGRNTIWKR